MENRNIHHPRVQFININNGWLVVILWKWRETSSNTSLLLIRTSSNKWFPDISVFNVVVVVFAQKKSDSGII